MTTQLLMADRDQALLEVDHLVVFVGESLPDVLWLRGLGLRDADRLLRREEQGTVSLIFFFANAYLEFVAVENAQAFSQYASQRKMNLKERSQWQQSGASPFSVGLRPKVYPNLGDKGSQFNHLESKIDFSLDNLAALQEPVFFILPPTMALTYWLDSSQAVHQSLITHPLGISRLTGVQISINTLQAFSTAVSLLHEAGIITIERHISPLLQLTFDDAAQDKSLDLRPLVPICLHY